MTETKADDHAAEAPAAEEEAKNEAVDRTRTVPFYLRMFVKENGRHSIHDFKGTKEEGYWRAPDGEVQTYVWPDTTLGDLAALVHKLKPATAVPDTRLKFAELVSRVRSGPPFLKPIGSTRNGRSEGESITLRELGFRPGDWLDVAAEHWTDEDEKNVVLAQEEKKRRREAEGVKRPRDDAPQQAADTDPSAAAAGGSSRRRRRRRRH